MFLIAIPPFYGNLFPIDDLKYKVYSGYKVKSQIKISYWYFWKMQMLEQVNHIHYLSKNYLGALELFLRTKSVVLLSDSVA